MVITPLRPAASRSRAQERTDLIDGGGGETRSRLFNGHRRAAAAMASSKRHETSPHNFPRAAADHIVSRHEKHTTESAKKQYTRHARGLQNTKTKQKYTIIIIIISYVLQ